MRNGTGSQWRTSRRRGVTWSYFLLLQMSSLTLPRPSITSSLKFANRSLAIAVPPLWNKLLPVLMQISDPSYKLTKTSPLVISLQLFHSKLKTLLFSKSCPNSSSSPYLLPILTPNTIHHSHLPACPTLWILTRCLTIFFWLSTCE